MKETLLLLSPYGIDTETLCYFVNYVSYPMGFDKSFKVVGWATANKGESWIDEQSAGKRVMLYISTNDTEHDNVFMTTTHNIGFKLGFGRSDEKHLLSSPEKPFKHPNIDITELNKNETKDYS